MKPKTEILSPVGNFPMLQAAISAQTDAIYLGLKEFNMRDSAKNFTLSELKKVKQITSKHKIRLYLTLNTIIYDSELKKAEKLIKKISKQKLADAIICWDLSIIHLCRKYKIPFHISTQASVSNTEAAKFYKKLGAKRIVLARELNLEQIKQISKIIPIETFIHGAMCVSISGRCFTSQFLENKSANRGQCTQPCRRAYEVTDLTNKNNKLVLKNNKVMSAKDLCTLPFLDKLKKAGITSFKIEGRNRSPEYVYQVTKIYKQALNKNLNPEQIKQAIEELKKVYHRGFSQGFYLHPPTSDDFSKSKTGEQTQSKQFIGKIQNYYKKQKTAHLKLSAGKLTIGDEIYIIGPTTGIIKSKITSMEIKNKPITQAKKPQEIGIKLPFSRKNDEVYLIIKN